MLRGMYLAVALVFAAPVGATQEIGFGSRPAWASPSSLPTATEEPSGVAAMILLDERHSRAEPGKIMNHSLVAVKFLTPDGLQGGTVAVQWRPDKDRIDVHRLVIVRDGKTIDVLAAGQKFTVLQREQNLEMATFDGRLTAVLQPEGLQVGDILMFEMTMTSSDPVMGRHVEMVAGIANDASAKRIRIRADWPSSLALVHRAHHLPAPVMRIKEGWTSVEWQVADPAPFVAPKSSPARFRMGRRIEFSDAKDWNSVAALVTPLFDAASVIPAKGPLRDEVERIRAASNDPVARAEAALVLVEDQIRYVALLMDSGNYVPASAEQTWSRRFGDCKAKTALLNAILRDLGIASVPVLVSSSGRASPVAIISSTAPAVAIGSSTGWPFRPSPGACPWSPMRGSFPCVPRPWHCRNPTH